MFCIQGLQVHQNNYNNYLLKQPNIQPTIGEIVKKISGLAGSVSISHTEQVIITTILVMEMRKMRRRDTVKLLDRNNTKNNDSNYFASNQNNMITLMWKMRMIHF